MKNYIGLVGYAGSGKDTVASMIMEMTQGYENFKFAGKLKEFCSLMYDIELEVFESYTAKNEPMTFISTLETYHIQFAHLCTTVLGIHREDALLRRLSDVSLEELGAEMNMTTMPHFRIDTTPRIILQKLGTEVFRNCYKESVWVDFLEDVEKAIITDVRFPNEAEKVKELGGILVRIENETQQNQEAMNHPSEAHIGQIDCDFTIFNDGKSLDNLKTEVSILLNEI